MLSKRELLKGAEIGKQKLCEYCVMGKQRRVKFNSIMHISMGMF